MSLKPKSNNSKSNVWRFAITSTLGLGLMAAAGCSQERYENSKWDQGSGGAPASADDATTLPGERGAVSVGSATTLPGGAATTLPSGRGATTLPSGATTLP